MKTLVTRTITGIAYLLILGFAFFFSEWALVAVFSFFLCIALFEFFNLIQKLPPSKNTAQHIFRRWIIPVVWIILPVFLLQYWCILQNATNIVVALFIILCLNDTLAYVFGSLLGKHKMFPKVSPKKSWEGFFGGLITTMIAGCFLSHIPYFQNSIFSNYYLWMGFSFVIIISGTGGDFAESMLKRMANQKDSGSILPGHGGVLDRIDSMLVAVPAGFIYWGILYMFKI